jgi:hypothetical protein
MTINAGSAAVALPLGLSATQALSSSQAFVQKTVVGITATEIKIGQNAPFGGPTSVYRVRRGPRARAGSGSRTGSGVPAWGKVIMASCNLAKVAALRRDRSAIAPVWPGRLARSQSSMIAVQNAYR